MTTDFFGPVRRWKEGDIYFAENDWMRLAWAATDDPKMIGMCGWHGPREIMVEYCSRETADKFERMLTE